MTVLMHAATAAAIERGVGGLMPGKASHVRHALKASRANGGVGYSMRIEIPTSYYIIGRPSQ